MKKIIFTLIIIHCSLIIANAQTGWYWMNPYPTANTIYSIRFVDVQTGYAVCEAGTVLKTINGGLNWNVMMLNKSSNLLSVHFINADTGMVAGEFGVAFRTTNGGINWINITINDSVDFKDIRFTNANTGIMVTGYNSGNFFYMPRIYKTTNGGVNWSVKKYGYRQSWLYSISYTTDTKVFVAGEGCLYRSTDAGETWDTVAANGFQNMGNTSVQFVNSATGFVSSAYYDNNNYIYYINKTIDGGVTWNKYDIKSYRDIKSIAFINSSTGIGVGRYSGVYRTTNGGVNWYKLPNAQDTMRFYYSVSPAGANNFMYAGDGGIIFGSTNAGDNFTRVSKSFTDETINWVSFINNQTGIVCGNNSAIYKTINGGFSWNQQNCPGSKDIIKAKLFNADTGIAVSNNGRVYKTINGGAVWEVIFYDSLAANKWTTADFMDAKYIKITGGHCAHSGAYTTNGGQNWTITWLECNCSGPPQTGCRSELEIIIADEKHQSIFGAESFPNSSGAYFIKATYDGGITWKTLFQTPSGGYMSSYPHYADTSNALVSVNYQNFGHIYRTFNGFRSWVDYGYPNNPNIYASDIALADSLNGIGFISQKISNNTYIKGIYKTTSGGQNWDLDGVVSNILTSLDYYKFNYAVAWGKYGGLISNQNPGIITGGNSIINILPEKYNLFQNYPNPFNPSTNIRFELPKNGFVKLVVYDELGREISTLINDKLIPGAYGVTFDGSNLPSGVYFYQLSADEFIQTKKMILLK